MDGKVVVLTGAASGMGLVTAKLLGSKGIKLSLADVQQEPLNKVVDEINQAGGSAIGTVVDIRDRAAVESWIAKTVETYGKLDGAANLAGVIGKQHNVGALQDIDDKDFDFIMDVNVKGLLNCLRAQVPNFNDGGAIVNAASVAGVIGFKNNAGYVASKHAVVGLTKGAAKELGARQIRVNCFCP